MQSFKVDILAFGAHPDDVECAASGVILKHIGLGKTAAIVDLTAGELGTFREQLGLPDGGIENNEASRLLVIQMIRKYQPEIVLANAIHDRHPDHANAAKLVADAAFLSGLKKKETFFNGSVQQAWRPSVVYHYIQDYFIQPDFVIDVTEQMDKKMEAILAFRSQFVEPMDNQPNSTLGLIDQIKHMNGIYGRPVNAAYAEGFTAGRYIGVNSFWQLI